MRSVDKLPKHHGAHSKTMLIVEAYSPYAARPASYSTVQSTSFGFDVGSSACTVFSSSWAVIMFPSALCCGLKGYDCLQHSQEPRSQQQGEGVIVQDYVTLRLVVRLSKSLSLRVHEG